MPTGIWHQGGELLYGQVMNTSIVAKLPENLTEMDLRTVAGQRLPANPSPYIFDARDGGALHIDTLEGNPELARQMYPDTPLRAAAVLVPVVMRERMTILLTQRTTHLPSHAGQIAFPGGKLEAGEADPVAAAIREAQEEIGLEQQFIEPIGFLDSVRTRTGYHITPVVALVQPGFCLDIDYSEVEEAFEVPFAFLMDPANHSKKVFTQHGHERHVYAMPFARRYIWGITAGILKNMHARLFDAWVDPKRHEDR